MRRLNLAILLLLGGALVGCTVSKAQPTPTAILASQTPPAPTETGGGEPGLPNPASVYCEAQGGRVEIIVEDQGERGYCVMPNDQICDEWDFYNGDCSFDGFGGGGGQALPTPTPWAFPLPVWDVTSKWPYGLPDPAIPFEPSYGDDVDVYVMLGSDWLPHRGDEDLTDLLMIVMIDKERDSATIISVPRDLYVYLPGFGMGRINQAWTLGRFDTVIDTFRYNFGLDVTGVVYGRIYAAQRFIDQGLGGLDVMVSEPVLETCGDLEVNLLPGPVFMDGEYALCYARGRTFSSDYNRMSRQQDILLAMRNRFLDRAASDPIGLAKELYGSYVESGVATDVSLFELPGVVKSVMDAKDTLYFYRIVPPLVEHFDHPESGAWLLQMPTPEAMHNFLFMALQGVGSDELR